MFNPEEIQVVSQAVEIAEDVTANHFKISTAWETTWISSGLNITVSLFVWSCYYFLNPSHSGNHCRESYCGEGKQ